MILYKHRSSRTDAAISEAVSAAAALLGKANRVRTISLVSTRLTPRKELRHWTVDADGVRCVWYSPDGAPIDRAVLYLHGGGFERGSDTLEAAAATLSDSLGLRLLAVDYSIGGGARFPVALEAAQTAYRWLLSQGAAPERLMLAGDSNGGGLALALAIRLRDSGEQMPSSMVLLAPWLDLTCSGESYRFARDNVLVRSALCADAQGYAGSHSLHEPPVSPLFGELNALPPTAVVCGTRDLLLSDAVELAKRMDSAGSYCELHLWRGQPHDFPAMLPFLNCSRAAISYCRSFALSRMTSQHA